MKLHPNTLLVEGSDDFHVIRNLWVARFPSNRTGNIVLCPESGIEFKIEKAGDESETGGITKLLNSMTLLLKQRPPALKRLGVVIDADEQLDRRWAQITNRLHTAGYAPPPHPPAAGLVLEHPARLRPLVGVWLMPNNRLPGKLENFVKLLISENDALRPKADRILGEIEQEELQRYEPQDRSKAFVHTWLAWQKKPGRPMGQAITAKILDSDSPLSGLFITWLQRLFCNTL